MRKSLGEDAIDADARQVTLAADVVALDTDDLESATDREDWEEAAALVERVDLWFEHDHQPHRTKSLFQKGVITFQNGVSADSSTPSIAR